MEAPQQTGAPAPIPAPEPKKHSHTMIWIIGILLMIVLLAVVAVAVYYFQGQSKAVDDSSTLEAQIESLEAQLAEKDAEIAETSEEEMSEDKCSIDSNCEEGLMCYRGTCISDHFFRKTFESEYGDFIYTLTWTGGDGERYEGVTEGAPSFDINGGGNITFATGQIDSPGYTMSQLINDLYYKDSSDWPLSEPEPRPTSAGTPYPVYYFYEPSSFSEGCFVQYGVIKGINEALSIRLEDCDGNDMKSGEAFLGALSNLDMTIKY